MKLIEVVVFCGICVFIFPKIFSMIDLIYEYKTKNMEIKEKIILYQEEKIQEKNILGGV